VQRRFLDIDILGPTCQLSLGQERSGEQHRKILTVLKSFKSQTVCDFGWSFRKSFNQSYFICQHDELHTI